MLNKKTIKLQLQNARLYLSIKQTWKLNNIRRLARVKKLEPPMNLTDKITSDYKIAFISHYNIHGIIQQCILRLICSLKESQYEVLIISGLLSEEAIEWCINEGVGYMIRKNQGRDFGAFQDAWLSLSQKLISNRCTNLILLNDSVYPLANLVETTWNNFLQGKSDGVLGLTDSYQNGYHLQSYALNIPRIVLNKEWWNNYWLNYPSWGGTAMAIKYGEIGLSQLIIKNSVKLIAIHSIVDVRSYSASEEFYHKLRDICSEHASELILKTILQTMNLSVSKISPAHQLAIPLLFMGFPFIKRDLLEANESLCSDPLLLITLKTKWVNSSELPEYLKPKPIGYKN